MVVHCRPVRKLFPPVIKDEEEYTLCLYEASSLNELPDGFMGREFVAAGALLPYSINAFVELEGEWERNKKTGEYQFSTFSYHSNIPSDKESIISFLCSVDGCNEAAANRIFNEFGADTLDRLDKAPSLSHIQGDFVSSYAIRRSCCSAFLFLRKMKVSADIARRVAMKAETEEAVKTAPYKYCISAGLPYPVAKKIAKAQGIGFSSTDAVKAALLEVLKQNEGASASFSEEQVSGNTYMLKKDLFESVAKSIAMDPTDNRIREAFASLFLAGDIEVDECAYVYRRALYRAEHAVASETKRLLSHKVVPLDYKEEIYAMETTKKMRLAPEQRRAVKICLSNPFSLLIGGPGCGKTTIEQFIIALFRKHNPSAEVLLLAPTGKAARRMSESTMENAETIHRRLKLLPGTDALAKRPMLNAGLIIVDEVSMLDTEVAAALLSSVQTGTIVVFVGDTDQLSSVGAGNVLFEMISSGTVPIAKLETVYRQKAGSTIAVNCARIRTGYPNLEYEDGVFEFLDADDDSEAAELAVAQFTKALDDGYSFDDVCLLSPYRRSTQSGVNALNATLQALLNSNAEARINYGSDKVFALHDKVMCTVNSDATSNGDTGYITAINGNRFTVDYGDGRVIGYRKTDMRDFELAYGMSIHKSQGQEFKVCIIIVSESHLRMLKRNILYTAVSRAKEKVILIGSQTALAKCIRTEDVTVKKSRLGKLLSLES